ncbi:hypothetical protein [Synechococcus sp. BO 8801]|uniref:hypothetical protein n=1 Tax=Synechococcus sp. BO 8801 TaxID=169670 RepID=UPI000B97E75B|nr:hypothetical protein [Synechococcus sp. BO 8801]
MNEALLVILLPLLVAGWVLQVRALERRVRRLEQQAASLSERFFALSLWSEVLQKRLDGDTPPEPARLAAAEELPLPAPQAIAQARSEAETEPVAAAVATPAQRPPAPPGPPRAPRPRAATGGPWKRIERLLVENWSGLLGVLVVVAGVTFLTINAGLELGPRERFLLTLLVGGALALPSVLWGRHPRWRDLTDAMRSGGGALVLFACAAAGGLPQLGLQWIEQPAPALALLAVGVAANLALAAIARTAAMASLHVAVSLVPLAIGLEGGPALAIAAAIALVGSELPVRHRWPRHRLVVSWVFGAFQVAWFLRNGPALAASPALVGGASLAAVLVFGPGLLRQHRPGATPARLQAVPAALLLSQWGGLALALLLYPPVASVRAGALAAAAAAALLLGQGARRGGPRWLALGDGLVGQTLVLSALLSLAPVIADGPLLAGVVLLESLLFLAIAVREGSGPLSRVGWWLSAAAGVVLTLSGLGAALLRGDPVNQLQTAAVLTVGAALMAAMQVLLQRRGVSLPLRPLLGWLAGGLVAVGTVLVAPEDWRSALSLVVMGAFLVAARRWRPPGLRNGITVAIALCHGAGWLTLLAQAPWPPLLLLARLLPLAVLALLLTVTAGDGRRQGLGMALLGVDAGLAVLWLLEPISPLLPGAAWLLLSAAALAGTRWLRGGALRVALGLSLAYLAAFGASFLLVIGPSQELVTLGVLQVRGRLLIELLAIAVGLHGWFFRPGPELARLPSWKAVQPCFLEAVLLGVMVLLHGEISAPWRPVAWTLLALLLVWPALVRRFAIRLQVYGVIVYWLAVASLLVGLSIDLPSFPAATGAAQTAGLVAIALQTAFVLACRRWLDLERLPDPGGWPPLAWVGGRVARRRNLWLGHPLFIAVAVVLASGYDRALLTLLWTAEAFAVYLLGVVLREPQFRRVALVGLGACLLRLLAIDMAQADLGLRGLVFVGVGLLLLALNALVHRFRSRFG